MQSFAEKLPEDDIEGRADLEDQIGRNGGYILELRLASDHLRSIARYWFFAAYMSAVVVIALTYLLFAQGRAIEWLAPTSIVGQTIATTLLALSICAAVFSFAKSVALQRLTAEATEVAKANDVAVQGALELVERIR